MKRTSLLATALLTLGLVFAQTGCSTFSKPSAAVHHTPTYALIASVSGGQAPTDAQWATMQKKFAALLEARGLVLVTDPSHADKLIQVLFVPDLDDPTTGVSYVVSIRNNPGNLLASTSRANSAMSSFGYATNIGFQPQYYGYYNDYLDYSQSSASSPVGSGPTTPPVAPPAHHHISRPVECPPDEPRRPPSDYATNHPTHSSNSPSSGNSGWSSRPSSDSGSSNYSSSSSYSGSSQSSSSYVGPTSSYSASASSSSPSISFQSAAPSYSPPAESSSSSSSSSDNRSSQPEKPL